MSFFEYNIVNKDFQDLFNSKSSKEREEYLNQIKTNQQLKTYKPSVAYDASNKNNLHKEDFYLIIPSRIFFDHLMEVL